jgi:hypothetical protein
VHLIPSFGLVQGERKRDGERSGDPLSLGAIYATMARFIKSTDLPDQNLSFV